MQFILSTRFQRVGFTLVSPASAEGRESLDGVTAWLTKHGGTVEPISVPHDEGWATKGSAPASLVMVMEACAPDLGVKVYVGPS